MRLIEKDTQSFSYNIDNDISSDLTGGYDLSGGSNICYVIEKLGHVEDIEDKHNILSLDDLDNRLTALEIITKKNVKIDILKYESDVVFYNMAIFENEEKLTKEEFTLLKKTLI